MIDVDQKWPGVGQVGPDGTQPQFIAAVQRHDQIERAAGLSDHFGMAGQNVEAIADGVGAGGCGGLAQHSERMRHPEHAADGVAVG